MELAFTIVAALLSSMAAYFVWKGDLDAVFVSLVLAACSALLVMRFRAKSRLAQRGTEARTQPED